VVADNDNEPEEQTPRSRDSLAALTNPGGLIGELVDWIVSSSSRPSRELALSAVIPFVGALLGRRFASQTDLRTNFYVVALAEAMSSDDVLDEWFLTRPFSWGDELDGASKRHLERNLVYAWLDRGGEYGFNVSQKKIQQIVDAFGVSREWLEKGRGRGSRLHGSRGRGCRRRSRRRGAVAYRWRRIGPPCRPRDRRARTYPSRPPRTRGITGPGIVPGKGGDGPGSERAIRPKPGRAKLVVYPVLVCRWSSCPHLVRPSHKASPATPTGESGPRPCRLPVSDFCCEI
jgi:hypothetical protein